MDKTKKLLMKIVKKDREGLLLIVERLIRGETKSLNIQKVKKTDFLRLRHDRFRVIFHYKNKEIFVDSIRLKNKGTYKKL
jgi:hypothetical protein